MKKKRGCGFRLFQLFLLLLLLLCVGVYFLFVFPFWGYPFHSGKDLKVPLTPAWALEPWLWEDDGNTSETILSLLRDYEAQDFPVRTILIDSPWSLRYNDFTVDEKAYPKPAEFFGDLDKRGYRVVLWMTPNVCSENDDTVIKDSTDWYKEAQSKGYLAGDWYPFADPDGRISDAKTVTVVGAALYRALQGGLLKDWQIQKTVYLNRIDAENDWVHMSIPASGSPKAFPLLPPGKPQTTVKMLLDSHIGRRLPASNLPEPVYLLRWKDPKRRLHANAQTALTQFVRQFQRFADRLRVPNRYQNISRSAFWNYVNANVKVQASAGKPAAGYNLFAGHLAAKNLSFNPKSPAYTDSVKNRKV